MSAYPDKIDRNGEMIKNYRKWKILDLGVVEN